VPRGKSSGNNNVNGKLQRKEDQSWRSALEGHSIGHFQQLLDPEGGLQETKD